MKKEFLDNFNNSIYLYYLYIYLFKGEVCCCVVPPFRYESIRITRTTIRNGLAARMVGLPRGYRFGSLHCSKSNKNPIESVTPPDFSNEISKYQFHVTLPHSQLLAGTALPTCSTRSSLPH